MSELKTAAIFCRVSTRDQRELSLDSQEAAVGKVLAQLGFHCPPEYALKAEWTSLDLMSCPQFQQLRRWIAAGEVAAVGVLDRDRLQAQGLQRLVFLSECQEQGVQVITAQGVPMLEGTEGQLVELALALGKERSVARAQQGARDGLRDRARFKGLPPNRQSPYGMKWQDQRLVPDQNYPHACLIWHRALEGVTMRGIARELTQQGIPTPKGGRVWKGSTIGSILANRTYAGVVEALKTQAVTPVLRRKATYGKTSTRPRPSEQRVPLEGLVLQPVVTQEEFDWVQQRRQHNQRYAPKNTRLRDYLLKGRLRCSICGKRYTGITRGNRSYYYCRGRSKLDWGEEKCPAQSLPAGLLEEAVWDSVTQFLTSPQIFLGEVGRRRELQEHTVAALKLELEDLERQARAEQDAEGQVFRLASRYGVSEEVFQLELAAIRNRLQGIYEQRQRALGQLENLCRGWPTVETLQALQQRLGAVLTSEVTRDRSFLLDALGVAIIAHGDGSWDLQLEIPREASATIQDQQIVTTEARLGWG